MRGKGDFLASGAAVDKSKGKNTGVNVGKNATLTLTQTGFSAGDVSSLLDQVTNATQAQIAALIPTTAAAPSPVAAKPEEKPADTGSNWKFYIGAALVGAVVTYALKRWF